MSNNEERIRAIEERRKDLERLAYTCEEGGLLSNLTTFNLYELYRTEAPELSEVKGFLIYRTSKKLPIPVPGGSHSKTGVELVYNGDVVFSYVADYWYSGESGDSGVPTYFIRSYKDGPWRKILAKLEKPLTRTVETYLRQREEEERIRDLESRLGL